MRPSAVLLIGSLLFVTQPEVQPRLSKADGERFQSKLTRIVSLGNAPRATKRTALSQLARFPSISG